MVIKVGDTVVVDGYSMKDRGRIGVVVKATAEKCRVKFCKGNPAVVEYSRSLLTLVEKGDLHELYGDA